jgi:hypothetical protein
LSFEWRGPTDSDREPQLLLCDLVTTTATTTTTTTTTTTITVTTTV